MIEDGMVGFLMLSRLFPEHEAGKCLGILLCGNGFIAREVKKKVMRLPGSLQGLCIRCRGFTSRLGVLES